mgnify:CR=1 FL=1
MSDKAIVISWSAIKTIGLTRTVNGKVGIGMIEDIPTDCIVLFIDKAEWPSISKQAGVK